MTKPTHLHDSALTAEDFAAFTPEDLAAGDVVINKITYNKAGLLTNIVSAGMDAITLDTIDVENGRLIGHTRYRRDVTLSFEEAGVPATQEGPWNPLVCTVPGKIGMMLMRESAEAEYKRRGPSANQRIGLLSSTSRFPEVLMPG